jgi:hypothetical protein
MASEDKVKYRKIQISCPTCNTLNLLEVPEKIINQSKHLTTISIPAGINCDHSFQAYIDKNFEVRGYQAVDFEFSILEYLDGAIEEEKTIDSDEASQLISLPHFKDILNILRKSVNLNEVLGCALFTLEGKVLYSSLPQDALFNIIREFEVRNSKKLSRIKKMYLELENDQKVCAQYLNYQDNGNETEFILILYFNEIKLGMCSLILRDIAQEINNVM